MLNSVIGPDTAERIGRAVNALGEDVFASAMLELLHGTSGAEYCTLLQLSPQGEARKIFTTGTSAPDVAERQVGLYLQGGRWRLDPMICEARQSLAAHPRSVISTMSAVHADYEYRELLYGRAGIVDRTLVCARTAIGTVALSVLRTGQTGRFTQEQLTRLAAIAPMLMELVVKHIRLASQSRALILGLTSLEYVYANLARSEAPLTARERDVCARMLLGFSALEIANDLGIAEETVVTYRKRLYERLSAHNFRELYLWYLDLWNALYLPGSHCGTVA